jgi:hypothetical protein
MLTPQGGESVACASAKLVTAPPYASPNFTFDTSPGVIRFSNLNDLLNATYMKHLLHSGEVLSGM